MLRAYFIPASQEPTYAQYYKFQSAFLYSRSIQLQTLFSCSGEKTSSTEKQETFSCVLRLVLHQEN